MGILGRKERPSERKRTANRLNATRPRGRWAGTPERESLEACKQVLREALPEGALRMAAIITDPKTPPELLLHAFRIAADRVGMPVLTQAEVKTVEPFEPKLVIVRCPDCQREHDLAPRLVGPAVPPAVVTPSQETESSH